MSQHRAMRDLSAATPRVGGVGPVTLFIAAVLIAGMTCILYLWQQSQIVAGQQEIAQADTQITLLNQQYSDLVAQRESLKAVTNVIAEARKYGMVQNSLQNDKVLALVPIVHPSNLAQAVPRNPTVVLPATNAAISSWWESAWGSLYSMLQ